jgi:mono/diheme cytochrome c family protein
VAHREGLPVTPRRRRLALLLAAGLAVLAACSARKSEPLRGPVVLSPEAAYGHVVFDRHCDRCHQGGEGGLGPSLNDKWVPTAAIRFQVRKGLGAMPSFPPCKLSDEDLDAVVCYLLTLRHR